MRWKQYFVNLLNYTIPDYPIPHTKYQRAEPCIEKLKLEEVETAILRLKDWIAPCSDGIAAELIKVGGKRLHNAIFQVCHEI